MNITPSIIIVKQGDYGPDATLAFTLTDPDNTITSLTGYTITLLVWQDVTAPIINSVCVFDSGMTFHYVPTVNDFPAPGAAAQTYQYEIEFGKVGGRLSTVTGTLIIKPSPTH